MFKILTTNIPNLICSKYVFIEQYPKVQNIFDISLALEYEKCFNTEVNELIRAYKIPKIGGERLPKHLQSIVMERLKINHPKSFFNRNMSQPFCTIEEFDSYVDLDEFIVKPTLGARGIGVKKINRLEYKKCIENKNEVIKVFKEENEYLKTQNDCNDDYIADAFACSMLIQEAIDVKHEFRVLFFKPNTMLVYERVKKIGQFCGNLSHGSEVKTVDTEVYNRYLEPMKSVFNQLLDDLNYPWLSIDVFVDNNDNVGIFEFQMEFAYEGFKPKDVRLAMTNSIEYFLKS